MQFCTQIRTSDEAARKLQSEVTEVKTKAAAQLKEAKQKIASLKQLLAVSEHRNKGQETEVEKLRAKLASLVCADATPKCTTTYTVICNAGIKTTRR